MATNLVNSISVKTVKENGSGSDFFKTDHEGVLISYSEKSTKEEVDEVLILLSQQLKLTEVKTLLEKVLGNVTDELKRREEKPDAKKKVNQPT
jgi:hypothetical protein